MRYPLSIIARYHANCNGSSSLKQAIIGKFHSYYFFSDFYFFVYHLSFNLRYFCSFNFPKVTIFHFWTFCINPLAYLKIKMGKRESHKYHSENILLLYPLQSLPHFTNFVSSGCLMTIFLIYGVVFQENGLMLCRIYFLFSFLLLSLRSLPLILTPSNKICWRYWNNSSECLLPSSIYFNISLTLKHAL